MTTTGPFELSGFAAGVSVEGPIASVSERFRSAGRAGFAGAASPSLGCEGCASDVSVAVGAVAAGALGAASDAGAGARALVASSGEEEAGSGRISTGLEDRASWLEDGGEERCWGALWAGVLALAGGSCAGEAIAGLGNHLSR